MSLVCQTCGCRHDRYGACYAPLDPPPRPRLLDLYCGAGGAARGYHDAGFDVTGIDLVDQPRYPYRFILGDALKAGAEYLRYEGFDAIHASPPCQDYSRAMRHLAAPGYPRLIDATRALLITSGLPWVIENVEGAPLPQQSTLDGSHGVMLCGSTLGLRVRRHRLFETSFPIYGPGCAHTRHAMNPHSVDGRERIYAEYGRQNPETIWAADMGVPWMNKQEAREAIPPAFTEYVGSALLYHLEAAA